MALLSVSPFETIIFFDYTPNFLKLHRHIEARLEYYLILSLLLGEGKPVAISAFIVKVLSNFLFLPPVLKLVPKADVFRLIPPFTARIVTAILPGCQ